MVSIACDNAAFEESVVALGKFQGLHRGHEILINEVVRIAGQHKIPAVLFTIDIKEEKSIYLPDERMQILEKYGIDAEVLCEFTDELSHMLPEEFIARILKNKLNAKYIVVGEDFHFGYNRCGDINTLLSFGNRYGYEVCSFEKISVDSEIVSTTSIKKYISNGEMENVNKYLGRLYSISGKVVYGKQLGRTIGYPTINIVPDERKILPPFGVYKTRIEINGLTYIGMTNIGIKPTVKQDDFVNIETYIYNFEGDLYGEEVKLEFERFIRRERTFKDLLELQKQIDIDKSNIVK